MVFPKHYNYYYNIILHRNFGFTNPRSAAVTVNDSDLEDKPQW